MKLFSTKLFLVLLCLCACAFVAATPTWAADYRTIKLARFLQLHNSLLVPYAQNFVEEADRNDFDYRLLAAISGVESTFGRNYPRGTYNAYGWGGGRTAFESWEDGIFKVSQALKNRYIDRGAAEVEQIAWIYCPPGNLIWAAKVRFFMQQIEKTEVTIAEESPIKMLSLTI